MLRHRAILTSIFTIEYAVSKMLTMLTEKREKREMTEKDNRYLHSTNNLNDVSDLKLYDKDKRVKSYDELMQEGLLETVSSLPDDYYQMTDVLMDVQSTLMLFSDMMKHRIIEAHDTKTHDFVLYRLEKNLDIIAKMLRESD